MFRIESAIGQQRIAKPADGGAHDIQLIINFASGGKLLVLYDNRYIIDSPLLRQQQASALFILDQHQPRQPHRHLPTGGPVLMGVKPAGGRPLRWREAHRPSGARGDNPLRSPVDLARDLQTMPVQRGLFCQLVSNVHRDGLPLRQLQRGPQQRAVIPPGGGVHRAKLRFARLDGQRDTVARIGRQQRRYRQGRATGCKDRTAPKR